MESTTFSTEERLVVLELAMGTMETMVRRLLGDYLDRQNVVSDGLRMKEDITESMPYAVDPWGCGPRR